MTTSHVIGVPFDTTYINTLRTVLFYNHPPVVSSQLGEGDDLCTVSRSRCHSLQLVSAKSAVLFALQGEHKAT